jgi:hypothetical protein
MTPLAIMSPSRLREGPGEEMTALGTPLLDTPSPNPSRKREGGR